MQVKTDKGLIVREHERKAVELPSEFTVCEAHAAQIHFTPESDSIGPHCIACTTVDISTGGAGIESRYFLPRMCEGVVRVYERGGASAERTLLLEEPVKVRRIEMMGRDGRYALGLAFTKRGPDTERRVAEVLKRLHGDSQEAADA
jgi:hypothetical protein